MESTQTLIKEPFMRRIALTGLIGLLFIAGCRQKPGNGTGPQAVPVKTAPVLVRRLSEPVRTSGFLSSEAEMKLSFKTGGIIDHVFARDGERVRKGQILATLKLDEIRSMAEQARNGYEKAKRDFARAQNLYRDSVATLEQIQDAQTGLNVAKSNLEIADFNLTHSSITAPSDGRILRRLSEANELIGPGYPALVFGTEGSEWLVKVGATDRDVVRIAAGDSASVTLDAFPGNRFAASVRSVGGAPDPMSGVFEVELSVLKGTRAFVNGLMADAEIFPSRKREYRVIPFEALVDVSDMRGSVYAVSPDQTARKLPVTIGFLSDGIAAVERGLEKTDRVVSEGAAYLSDGIPVRQVEN
jgi:membrane fusion protein, multidrug efflux system